MFFIPGWLIGILTFPGVIVHETAHRFFADLAGVPVYQVCYFRVGNPAGYVIHGPAKSLRQAFLISIGPLILNTLLCSILTFSAVYPVFILGAKDILLPFFMILMWLGYSVGMHAFPSGEDMNSFLRAVETSHGKGLVYLSAKLFSLALKLANALRVVWFDLIYAVGVSLVLPICFGAF